MKLSSPIELIKKSFQIFFEKKNLVYFLKIYSPLIPFSLFTLFQNNFVASQSATLNTGNPSLIISKYPLFLASIVIVNLLYLIVSFWVGFSGIKAIAGILDNKTESIRGVYAFAWKNLWSFSLLSILFGLMVLGGGLLLVIPAIIFGVWFSFAKFVFVSEGKGVIKSFGASRRLVEGKFWKVLGRLIIFGLFSGLAGFLVSALPYAGAIITAMFGALFVLPYFLLYKELVSSGSATV